MQCDVSHQGKSLFTGKNELPKNVYFNLSSEELTQHALNQGKGKLSRNGALVVKTGKFTGRAAKDKYVVKTADTNESVWWENDLLEMNEEQFDLLQEEIIQHLSQSDQIYVTERSVGADPVHHLKVKLITSSPTHSQFANYMFRDKLEQSAEEFTILHAPLLEVDPKKYQSRSGTIITTHFGKKIVLICGTQYAGEIKKSAFSIMNYLLPEKNILPMHSGANIDQENNVSIFFGLSGTGKTTLSTDDGKLLIGDDEHGLSDEGVFNFEGGCYAKTYRLNEKSEPGIYKASTRTGSFLENVVMNEETREVDFNSKDISENGRSSYPLSFISEVKKDSRGPVPNNIFFLTADAFGVLPSVAKLSTQKAMEYFVLGYTAKLAGTEAGIKEPQATFSPCFGAPFMLRHPTVYANLLKHHIEKHNIDVWLVNTGWTNGPFGVGHRFPISVTRNIIRSIQNNNGKNYSLKSDDYFGFELLTELDGVQADMLNPINTWDDKEAYDKSAKNLAQSFTEQLSKFGM